LKRYEAMFLFDNAVAHEWPAVEQEVRRLTGRIGAELLACVKFDERKLSYEIRGRKRGTYVLTYFDAPPDRITELERDARLSETLLRALILRSDGPTPEKLAELRAHPPDKPLNPMGGDGRREDRGERRDDRGGEFRRDERERERGRRERGGEESERADEGTPEGGGPLTQQRGETELRRSSHGH
jgi:small subunit ribosomal protein S6